MIYCLHEIYIAEMILQDQAQLYFTAINIIFSLTSRYPSYQSVIVDMLASIINASDELTV